jgi:hypothetical protein
MVYKDYISDRAVNKSVSVTKKNQVNGNNLYLLWDPYQTREQTV